MLGDPIRTESTMTPPPPINELQDAFSADFEHDLRFTRSVLDPANPLLEDLLGWKGPGPRPGMIAVIDSGLHEATPGLLGDIERRFAEARSEIRTAQDCGAYDAFVVNDDLDRALAEMTGILESRMAIG